LRFRLLQIERLVGHREEVEISSIIFEIFYLWDVRKWLAVIFMIDDPHSLTPQEMQKEGGKDKTIQSSRIIIIIEGSTGYLLHRRNLVEYGSFPQILLGRVKPDWTRDEDVLVLCLT
jgi:hypothetical protein